MRNAAWRSSLAQRANKTAAHAFGGGDNPPWPPQALARRMASRWMERIPHTLSCRVRMFDRDYDLFLQIVECGSISAAARGQGQSVASLSNPLARLEQREGARPR